MKTSEVTSTIVKDYINNPDAKDSEIAMMLSAAKAYIVGNTGLPLVGILDEITGVTSVCVDDYEDLTIALLVLCSDMYDNRQMTVDKGNTNKIVDTILNLHCVNLL